MKYPASSLLVAMWVALFPGPAVADSITVLDLHRFAGAFVFEPNFPQDPTDLQFDRDVLSASVTTTVADATLTAAASLKTDGQAMRVFSSSGSITASRLGGGVTSLIVGGNTQYAVTFQVDTPQPYAFQGAFITSGTTSNSWTVALSDVAVLGSFDFLFSGTTSRNANWSGFLAPGRYIFNAFTSAAASTEGSGGVEHSFGLTLLDANPNSPTPEPGSLLLLGTGISGLLASRQRRQVSRSAGSESNQQSAVQL